MINNTYIMTQGHECLSSCLGSLLGFYNQDIKPNRIIMLGDGFKIWFDPNQKVISSDMYGANYRFLDTYSVAYEKNSFFDNSANEYDAIDREIIKILDEGKIPIVRLISKGLTYNRVFSQAENAIHYICIVGYEDSDYYICDAYVPTKKPTVYEGKVNKGEIIDGIIKAKGKKVVLDDPSIVNRLNIEQAIIQKIKEAVFDYIQGGENDGIYYGKDAALKFFEMFANNGENNTRDEILEYNFQLKIYGFLSLKEMLYEEVDNNFPKLNGISEQIVKNWNEVNLQLLKCGFKNSIESYDKLMTMMRNCLKEEMAFLDKVINYD